MNWSVGVTTIPERVVLFNRTVRSIESSGFKIDHIFVDGFNQEIIYDYPYTIRNPKIRTAGNWLLAAGELYIRNPISDFYVIFQDDLVISRNARQYLESCSLPDNGYFNLFTFKDNESIIRDQSVGWYESSLVIQRRERALGRQTGRGALALMFTNEGMMNLLSHSHILKRTKNKDRGHRLIDGGIVESMNQSGFREYVHNPSFISHTGTDSSMTRIGRSSKKWRHNAQSFKGEDFDMMSLLC